MGSFINVSYVCIKHYAMDYSSSSVLQGCRAVMGDTMLFLSPILILIKVSVLKPQKYRADTNNSIDSSDPLIPIPTPLLSPIPLKNGKNYALAVPRFIEN